MDSEFFPFVLIPLLIYTYFWLNPTALASFMEGVTRYLVEIYLGYKAWRIEQAARIAFRSYQRQLKQLAQKNRLPGTLLKSYRRAYEKDDWKFIYQREKQEYEERNRSLEDEIRDLLVF